MLICNILNNVVGLNKPQKDFFIEIMLLFLSIQGRMNFLQFGRYISKSGKKTPGVDKFWSGVAGVAKFGLEIGGIAAIDIDNKTAFHLEAMQTPTYEDINKEGMTLLT